MKATNWLGAGDPWTLFTEPFTGAYNQANKIKNTPLRYAAKTGIGAADLATYIIPFYNVARGAGQGVTGAVRATNNLSKGNYAEAGFDALGAAASIGLGGAGKALTTGLRQGAKAGLRAGSRSAASMVPKTLKYKLLMSGMQGAGGGTQAPIDDVARMRGLQQAS